MKETDSLYIQISELIDSRIAKYIGGGQSSTLQSITGVAIDSDRNLNQVVNELSKLFITKSEFSSIDGRIDDLSLAIQHMVDEVIVEGLDVNAQDPPSSNVTITAGFGGKRGRPCRLDTAKTVEVPLDEFSSIFYITLQSYGQVNVRRSKIDDELTLAKIVVPKPGTSSAIIDDQDDSYDAYIVSAKDAYFDGDTVFDEDSKAVLRDAIGDILADNLIGNIRLSENLKIINTQGTVELDSQQLLIKDTADNTLSRFDKDGIYIFDAEGFERAHFTGDEARVGNIIVKPESLESQNFVSGLLGSGFRIQDSGFAEFKDVLIRGKISSSIFEYNSITAVGGNILVSHDADKLAQDMTTISTSLVTDGDVTFEVGDIIWLKEGNNGEHITISSVTDSSNYTVTRESGGTAISWQKGTALVNLGQSGDGGIYITASESTAPYLSVFTHDGSPWDGLSTKLRLGNLNGFLGYSSDLYGIAIGEATKYLKYDPDNGLRIAGNTLLGSLSISTGGYINSGQTAYDTGIGFWLEYNSGTPRFSIGDTSANKLTWDGSTLTVRGTLNADDIIAGTLSVDRLGANTITADKYNQLRNTYVINREDSLDASYPFTIPFKIVSELLTVQSVKLSFKILNFRAYATTVASGGGATSGGQGSASGGSDTSGATGSASGGGSTSGSKDGAHVHTIAVTNSTSGSTVQITAGDIRVTGGGTVTTSSVESHTHTFTLYNDTGAVDVYHNGSNRLGTSSQVGSLTSSVTNGHTHDFGVPGYGGSLTNLLYYASGTFRTSGGATITTTSNKSDHTHTTPAHTHPNHTHTTPDHTHPSHTHTTPNHVHGITYGIYEDSQSPTINYYIDNGAGYGGASGNITTDQTDIDITGSITGTGWKAIRFNTDARCRIAAIIEAKLDIDA